MTLNINSQLCRQCYACCDKTADGWGQNHAVFHYKVWVCSAIRILSLTTKLKESSLEFQALLPISLRPELN